MDCVPAPTPTDLLDRYDDELRRRLPPPPTCSREVVGALTRIVGPARVPMDHMVCHGALGAGTADAAIDRLVEEARRGGHGVQWNVYGHDEPADLAERLGMRGFRVQARETVMVVRSDDVRAAKEAPPEASVVRVRREEDLGEFVRVQEEVWGNRFTPWDLRWFAASFRGEGDPVGVLVARVAGEPAGAAWVALPENRSFACFFGGTVREAFRSRGVYRALVCARARLAREAGFPWLVADANSSSRPRLERMGFAPLCARTEMVLDPA